MKEVKMARYEVRQGRKTLKTVKNLKEGNLFMDKVKIALDNLSIDNWNESLANLDKLFPGQTIDPIGRFTLKVIA